MTDITVNIWRATRIHVLPEWPGPQEAAGFLVSSLLISHGIRREALALIRVRGGLLAAPGWTLRQLRPDLDTAEGWLRAALSGKARRLGATILRLTFEAVLEEAEARGYRVVDTCPGEPGLETGRTDGIHVIVHRLDSTGGCWLRAPCGPGCRAAISNVLLDRGST